MLRSIPFYAAPGNHDLLESDLGRFPDALAYFFYWDPPRNGPVLTPGGPGAPPLKGSSVRQAAFLAAAGPAYPRTTNFSFDRGGIHWTVLDSDPYVDWSDPALLGWLEADLASPAAHVAAWRLVVFHHAPFHSSRDHGDEQEMRVLAPVFEKAGVAIAFSGHVHNYQRSRPLRFVPAADPRTGKLARPSTRVHGQWTLDRSFDGSSQTQPKGVIYILSGAGGAKLYNTDQHDRPGTWLDFTDRFVSNVHSFTQVDATADRLTLRQISARGEEVDRIVITRSGSAPAPR